MNKLEKFSDAELQAELARREEALRKELETIPQPLDNIDWSPVLDYVTTSVKEMVEDDEGRPKDFDHWIFETVMETIYGDKIWEWWNKRQ